MRFSSLEEDPVQRKGTERFLFNGGDIVPLDLDGEKVGPVDDRGYRA